MHRFSFEGIIGACRSLLTLSFSLNPFINLRSLGSCLICFLLSGPLTVSLLTTLLKRLSKAVKVLLEVGGALDRDLERWLRLGLDLDYTDVAPSGEHVDNLSQLGHAPILVADQLQVLVLAHIQDILDDANVLRDTKAIANDEDVAQVLLLLSTGVSIGTTFSSALRSTLRIAFLASLRTIILLLPLVVVALGSCGLTLGNWVFAILAITSVVSAPPRLPLPGLLLRLSCLSRRGGLVSRGSWFFASGWSLLGLGLDLLGDLGGGHLVSHSLRSCVHSYLLKIGLKKRVCSKVVCDYKAVYLIKI